MFSFQRLDTLTYRRLQRTIRQNGRIAAFDTVCIRTIYNIIIKCFNCRSADDDVVRKAADADAVDVALAVGRRQLLPVPVASVTVVYLGVADDDSSLDRNHRTQQEPPT